MAELRAAVIAEYVKGYKPGHIFKHLKPLGINRKFVYRTINRYLETGGTEDKARSGRPRSVRTPRLKKIIRDRIRRNPAQSARKLARNLKMNRESIRLLLRKDLKLTPYKKQVVHGVTKATKDKRYQRSRKLLGWRADDEIIFSDEKLFVLEQTVNRQNDRVWSVSLQQAPADKLNVSRFQNKTSVMVWGAICKRGKLPLIFIDKGVKINAAYYLDTVLKKNVLPQAELLFEDDYYCFQQDGAPSHTAKVVQAWCEENLTDFISKNEWPPSSPDLNPLDYFVWGYMMSKLNDYKITNLEQFKRVITKIWDEMPMEHVRAACDDFPRRLKLIRSEKGSVIPRYRL